MPHYDRRSFLKASGAAGAVGLTGLSGCLGGITGGGETPTVRLGWVVPVENFGSLLGIPGLQDELPNLGDAYEFESVPHSSTPEGVNSLAAGDTDMTLMTTVSYANAIARDAVPGGVTAISTDFWDAHPDWYGFTIFSHGDSDITEPEDLEGQRLGVNATGTGIHAILVKQVIELGLDPDEDVEFVEFDFPAFVEAINSDQFDAGIFPALFGPAARGEGFNAVFRSQDLFDPYPFAYTVAANNALDEKGDAIEAWGEDFVHIVEWAQDNRSDVVTMAAEHFELPESLLDSYFLTENDYFRGDLNMDVEALNTIMEEMVELGYVEEHRDYGEHASNDYLP